MTPQDESGKGKIGVLFAEGNRVHRELGLGAAFAASLDWNARHHEERLPDAGRASSSARSRCALFRARSRSRASPAKRCGEGESFLTLLALISLQLGILNLMPIPVLDGGHILILGCEGLLRRDLSDKLEGAGHDRRGSSSCSRSSAW